MYDFPGDEVTAIAARDGAIAVVVNEFGETPAAQTPTKSASLAPLTPGTAAPARPRPGKGRLWRISTENRAEQLYSNDDGQFTAVQISAEGVMYVASGAGGRVYRVAPDRTSATWIDVDERQVLAIDLGQSDPIFVTGDGAALYHIVAGRPGDPTWTSKVLDTQFASRFGALTWRATGTIEFQTRTGNTREPDATWSDWSASMATPGPIRSAGAAFCSSAPAYVPILPPYCDP